MNIVNKCTKIDSVGDNDAPTNKEVYRRKEKKRSDELASS